MPTVPNALALATIADGSVIVASDHRNNYAALQTFINALQAILAGGAAGQVLGSSGGTTVGWTGATSVPAGALVQYGAAAAPSGWLLCDGSAVSRATYATLFGVIASLYGNGDGSTTFNLPDLRGRVPVGYAAAGGHTDVSTLGLNDGVAAANRRAKHRHTAHSHTVPTGAPDVTGGAASNPSGSFTNGPVPTTNSVDGGSGNANDSLDAPAYVVVNFIIKT